MGSLEASSLTTTTNPLDPEEFRRQGYMVVDFLTEYYKNINKYPVRSQVKPGYLQRSLPMLAPEEPEPIETILKDIQTHIIPGLSHWQSPNHYAYYPCTASIAGVLGETLAAGFNVVGFHWISSPAATELETVVMDWLANMLNLPKSFTFSGGGAGGGVMMGTTCEAMIATISAARDRVLDRSGGHHEIIHKLVVYGSDQTHFSFFKSAKIAGISPSNFRKVKTSKAHLFSLTGDSLRATIESDINSGLIPLFLCVNVGTTSTGAVDPVADLCAVAKEFGLWVHIDAANAGSACICPEYRSVIDGVEGVDSFSFNAHKWLLATLDCCCVWVKDSESMIKSLSTNPEIMKNKASESQQVVDYKDWQIALSRRFRSLKMWLVLRSYGAEYLRVFIRSRMDMVAYFERLVLTDKRFQVVVPMSFGLVCFRLSPLGVMEERMNQLNAELLESINSGGGMYMTHSLVNGVYVLRFAVGATLTQTNHVQHAWKLVQDHATSLLASMIDI